MALFARGVHAALKNWAGLQVSYYIILPFLRRVRQKGGVWALHDATKVDEGTPKNFTWGCPMPLYLRQPAYRQFFNLSLALLHVACYS